MGSKGATTTTNQQQTYNPAGAGYIQNALNQAGNAASLPFNIPQAPVAGFSQDQQSAFNNVNNAQGMAQPYINQANNYFQQSAQRPDVASYYNPMAANVTSQLQNIFGQQNSQNTGQLTQAAGGVGADRISVGQANLANQQGLAAGQTYAGLWQQAQQAATQQQSAQQSAAYGTAALGSQAQNAALQGAQAQLGTGGLQQQLQQAQLNSPYQQQLAQAAFPYQQAQFLAGITGALAPGLGGTTTGTGSQTSPGPSIWSQLLGLGTAGVGAAGGAGAFKGGSGKGSGSPSAAGTPGSPYYGPVNDGSYAEGGEIPNDEPVDVSHGYIPDEKLTQIQPNVPKLNLTPQQPQGGGGGSGGVNPADIMKLAMAFMARGGSVNPYAFADAGVVPDLEDRFAPVKDAIANGDFDDQGINYTTFEKATAPTRSVAPPPATRSMSYAPDDTAPAPAVAAINKAASASNPYAGDSGPQDTSGASAAAPAPEEAPSKRDTGFAGSPWAALMAAGLGIAGGTSPYAGVNIGQGGLQGLKMLESQRAASQKDETADQAAARLRQEAKFHEMQYTRTTPHQRFEMSKPFAIGQRVDPTTGQTVTTYGMRQPDGSIKPVDPAALAPATPGAPAKADGAPTDDAALPPNAKSAQGFLIPGKNAPDNADPSVLSGQDPGMANMVRAIDEGRMSLTQVPMKQRYMVQRLLNAYDPGFDQTVWGLRNKQQADMSTNGTAGKMLTAVNQLLPHLKTGYDSAVKLANTDYPEANTIKNWWLTATGDSRVKTFNTVREVAAMDAARLLRGSGQMAEKDIEAWRENLANSGSPAQLKDTIELLAKDLIGARISSIQHEYRTNMRREPPELLSPEAKEALGAITSAGKPPAGAAAPAAAALPAGGAGDPLAAARAAIANGKDRDAVIQRLKEHGIDPTGL